MGNDKCICSQCNENTAENWNINLGQAGYFSKLDGAIINFNLCDKCLLRLIKSFPLEHQEKIINSGSNTYLSSEDWLRKERGELTDIEKREMGLKV